MSKQPTPVINPPHPSENRLGMCNICLEDVNRINKNTPKDLQPIITKCRHLFHRRCIEDWKNKSFRNRRQVSDIKCPNCQRPMFEHNELTYKKYDNGIILGRGRYDLGQCAICGQGLRAGPSSVLDCGCKFHDSCLDKIAETTEMHNCPKCHEPITGMSEWGLDEGDQGAYNFGDHKLNENHKYNTKMDNKRNISGMVWKNPGYTGLGRYRRRYRYTKGRYYRGKGIYDGNGNFFGNIWGGIKKAANWVKGAEQSAVNWTKGAVNTVGKKVLPVIKKNWRRILTKGAEFVAPEFAEEIETANNLANMAGIGGNGRYRRKYRYTRGRFYRGRGIYDGQGGFWGDRWNEVKSATNWVADKVVDNAGAIADYGFNYITNRAKEQQQWKDIHKKQKKEIDYYHRNDPNMQPD